jgi:Tol biopolymer transport system component
MALVAGTRLAHYEIRAHLGSGGMGEVYRAHDLTLHRDVALKVLPSHLGGDPDRLRRFEQEARAASALNHPAIVAIYELGRADEQPYISMELVDGRTVRQLVAHGPLPPRKALSIAAQIASALAKAHAAGIVHRDLKPENLMVSSDDHAKILDFGLAKLTGDPLGPSSDRTTIGHATRAGVVLGTVAYMSPEQAAGAVTDFRSDQFSFGLVLYEMLTGRQPFDRPTSAETMAAIIKDDLPPLGLPSVPVPVQWILDRCLTKAPEQRYASTHDLARDLANVRDHVSGGMAPATVSRKPKQYMREVAAWSLAAILGVAVLALVIRDRAPTGASSAGPVRMTLTPPPGGVFHMGVGETPFAFSPDGHRLAFVAVVEARRQIWVRSFDSLDARALAGTEGASSPFWSPDGTTIGFFAGNKLKRVPAVGGDVGTICDSRGGGGATWNRDDVILFAPSIDGGLWRVAAGGGTPAAVTTLDAARGESGHYSPIFLPDGRHYVFGLIGGDGIGLYLASLDSAERTLLLPGPVWPALSERGDLFYWLESNLMAQRLDVAARRLVGDPIRVAEGVVRIGPTPGMAVSPRGDVIYWPGDLNITQLTWVSREGKTLGTVGPPGPYMNVRISPDGKRAAVDRFDPRPSIWVADLDRPTMSRMTSGNVYDSTPIWAPDGKSFAFALAVDTPPNLYVKAFDAQGDVRRLFRSTLQSFPQSWSRDGVIAFIRIDPKTNSDIWLVPATGDREPWAILQTPFVEMHARISPDGRWLAYVSDESGQNQVYVTQFPKPAGKWTVSSGAGAHPVWRHDSRELYYRAADGMLMAVSVGAGSDFNASAAKPLFKVDARPGRLGLGTYYDVAADGRFLMNLFVERTSSPAVVILNWAPPTPKAP